MAAFITRENIRELIRQHMGLWGGGDRMHIDLDGNDCWIWPEIDLEPAVVIVEYNSTFGIGRAITVPYAADFQGTKAHCSNLYCGSSQKALQIPALQQVYGFIGCKSAGNNAYSICRAMANARIVKVSLERGCIRSKYRESRDSEGKLTFLSVAERVEAVRGMPVFDAR